MAQMLAAPSLQTHSSGSSTLELLSHCILPSCCCSQTDSKYTLMVSGTGHAGMEAAIANLIEPGEKIIVGNAGIWGARVADLSARYHGERCKLYCNVCVYICLCVGSVGEKGHCGQRQHATGWRLCAPTLTLCCVAAPRS